MTDSDLVDPSDDRDRSDDSDHKADVARAESFFEQLASDPRFAPFVPVGDAWSEQAERHARYVRNVLRGHGTQQLARKSGVSLARRGVPLGIHVRGWRHYLLAELRRAAAHKPADTASMVSATERALDDLAAVVDAATEGEQLRRDRLREFDHAATNLRGTPWFEALVASVRRETQADMVFVGELSEDGSAVVMLALSTGDPNDAPFRYELVGTPCQRVLQGDPCAYPSAVARSFPEDLLLSEMNVDGYLGVPLVRDGEQPIGLLVALYTRPIGHFRLLMDTLERYSRRASAELLRQRHVQAVARERAEFQMILESLPDPAAVHQDGRLVWANQRLVDVAGYATADELLGMPILDLVHPEAHERVLIRTRQMMESGVVGAPHTWRIVRKDGSTVPIESTATPITHQGRPAVAVLGRDLTTRRQGLRRDRHFDRLALLDSVGAGLGHEINNPLTFMMANLRFASEGLDSLQHGSLVGVSAADLTRIVGEIRANLDDVSAGCVRIGTAVRAVQSLTADQDVEATCVALEDCLEEAIALAGLRSIEGVRVERDYGGSASVQANPMSLTHALSNVLQNAAEACLRGGVADPCLRIVLRRGLDEVQVMIEDNGAGISAAYLNRVFEPFVTTKMRDVATGLSLSVTRDIIERMGGHISAENRSEGGARFTIALPAPPHPDAAA